MPRKTTAPETTPPESPSALGRSDLENSLLFRDVAVERIFELLEDCPVRTLKPGEVLIQGGESGRSFYLLLSGSLQVHLKSLDEKPIGVLGPGEVVGELSLIDHQPASAHVVAEKTSRVLVMSESKLWLLLEKSATVARNFLYILSTRLRRGNALLESSLLENIARGERHEFVADPPALPKRKRNGSGSSLYQRAESYILKSFQRARKGEVPSVASGEKMVREMIRSLEQGSELLRQATERKQQPTVSNHALNVTILALRVGIELGLDSAALVRVGLAGLLHEIGVVKLQTDVSSHWEVQDRLKHGSQILSALPAQFDWLAAAVRQVYEREDGSGFPLGLKREEIREEAKILGIADAFEACIHDRPHRRALTGYEIIHELTRRDTGGFPEYIVKAVVRSLTFYPYNEYVLLNTDEVAQVVEVNPGNLSRPRVKILCDVRGEPSKEAREIDLSKDVSVFITSAVPYHLLPRRSPGSGSP